MKKVSKQILEALSIGPKSTKELVSTIYGRHRKLSSNYVTLKSQYIWFNVCVLRDEGHNIVRDASVGAYRLLPGEYIPPRYEDTKTGRAFVGLKGGAKTYRELSKETGLTQIQLRSAIKILNRQGKVHKTREEGGPLLLSLKEDL